jgi:hypothetical protein
MKNPVSFNHVSAVSFRDNYRNLFPLSHAPEVPLTQMGSNGYNGEHMSSDEKTLDEALDEIDRWSEPMVRDLEGLAPEQVCEYFRRVQAEFAQKLGRPLDLPVRHDGVA